MLGHLALVDEQAIDAVADELLRRSEMMQAREARFGAQVRALDAAHQEMRSGVRDAVPGHVHAEARAGAAARRPARPASTHRRCWNRRAPAADAAERPRLRCARSGSTQRAARALDSWKYVGFEDHFRGPRDEIRRRQADYVPEFAGASRRARCGMRAWRVPRPAARGRHHRARPRSQPRDGGSRAARAGSPPTKSTCCSFLRTAPDGSLGGLFAAQVIEHLEPDYLMQHARSRVPRVAARLAASCSRRSIPRAGRHSSRATSAT